MTFGDSYTIATALSFAIAAIEALPAELREPDELDAMRALFVRILPDEILQAQFLIIARDMLAGRGKPFERPRLVDTCCIDHERDA